MHKLVDGLGAKRNGASWMAPCPAHHDPNPSLAIRGENGTVLVRCHAGCTQDAVISALRDKGLWESVEAAESPADVFEADYTYRDASGKAVGIKSRYRTSNGKRFVWRVADHENCKGLREHDLRVEDMPLYGAEFLSKAREQGFALLVEGEKAAQACWRANLIAFCNPGGSGQKDFGASLDILRGLDVVLWPDNDEPGRALMRAIKDKLGQARIVAPELPEKGDAVEYFLSHTKQDFLGLLDKLQDRPWVEEINGGYLVSIPESGGLVRFAFTGMDGFSSRNHQAEVRVWLEIPGQSAEPFETPLNFMSVSGREAFRRQVEDALPLGKGVWGKILNKAISLARQTYQNNDPSIPLCQVTVSSMESRYLLRPWIPDAPGILFGQGGSGKSYLALAMAVSLATGAPFLGTEPLRRESVLFLDYEDSAEQLAMRLQLVQAGLGIAGEKIPDIHYWPGEMALSDMTTALSRKINKDHIGLIIIDSAIAACSGPPKEPEVAAGYFNALRTLGIPSLTISHVVKDEEGDKFPFGSIMWSNRARLTWNVKVQQEEGDSILHVGLFNRKGNNDRKLPSVGLRIEFEPDAVTIRREDVTENFSSSVGAKTQIMAALRQPLCAVCLSDETGIGKDSVRVRLNELKSRGRVIPLAERCPEHNTSKWGLRERDAR